jgi:glucokinase
MILYYIVLNCHTKYDDIMGYLIGIDIGATNLRIALTDEGGEIKKAYRQKTDAGRLVEQISEVLDGLPAFEKIGIASFGPLNYKKGMITNPPNINIKNLPIVDMLKKRYNVECSILNDCASSVVAEKTMGAGVGYENIAYVTLSSGIGCGVISNGKLLLGKEGNANEVGHYMVDPQGKVRCGCGSYGHWQAYSAGKYIPSYVSYLLQNDYKNDNSKLREEEITSESLFKLAPSDSVAMEIVERIGRINATMFANIVNTYDPEIISIGGSVALNNKDLVIKPIVEHTGDYVVNVMPKIVATPLGHDACLYGAIASMLHKDWMP